MLEEEQTGTGLVTRDGIIQQNNLSLRGGTKSTKYFLSGNLFNQDGVIKNSGLKREVRFILALIRN